MKTLNDLKQNIDEILKEHPKWGALPIVYSSDNEGNNFHKVFFDISPMQFHDINAYYLEQVGNYKTGSNEISEKDVNAICIN